MIEHWTSEDGIKAIGRMGFPQWEEYGDRYGLLRETHPEDWAFLIHRQNTVNPKLWHVEIRHTHDRVSLSILRDHAREWLENQDITIEFCGRSNFRPVYRAVLAQVAGVQHLTGTLYDYDQALIAAILAAGE